MVQAPVYTWIDLEWIPVSKIPRIRHRGESGTPTGRSPGSQAAADSRARILVREYGTSPLSVCKSDGLQLAGAASEPPLAAPAEDPCSWITVSNPSIWSDILGSGTTGVDYTSTCKHPPRRWSTEQMADVVQTTLQLQGRWTNAKPTLVHCIVFTGMKNRNSLNIKYWHNIAPSLRHLSNIRPALNQRAVFSGTSGLTHGFLYVWATPTFKPKCSSCPLEK